MTDDELRREVDAVPTYDPMRDVDADEVFESMDVSELVGYSHDGQPLTRAGVVIAVTLDTGRRVVRAFDPVGAIALGAALIAAGEGARVMSAVVDALRADGVTDDAVIARTLTAITHARHAAPGGRDGA